MIRADSFGACVACVQKRRLGPVDAACRPRNNIGYQLPWKADGGIPGLDERHQDVDTIRAYGLRLVISANEVTSCDNRNFPRYRPMAGISDRGKFLCGHSVRAPSSNGNPRIGRSGGGGRDQSSELCGNRMLELRRVIVPVHIATGLR